MHSWLTKLGWPGLGGLGWWGDQYVLGGLDVVDYSCCELDFPCGAVAQMGERRVRNAEVGSSILLGSTK